jgi:hypothetical protein
LVSSVADPVPGSRIQDPVPFIDPWTLIRDPGFFLQNFKNKIIYNFVKFMATKKGFFSPLSFVTVFASGIRDPRSGIRDK